jgi:hypothetical protein
MTSMNVKMGMAAVAAAGMLAGGAQATDTLQLDVNAMEIQVRDSGGAATAFGGVTHSGSIDFGFSAASPATSMVIYKELGLGSGFSFEGAQAITDVDGFVSLTAGLVTGGEIAFTLANGDIYSAKVKAGSGMVETAATPGGFSIDGLTFDGDFFDAQPDGMYGTVDVSQWISGEPLFGSFLEFNFSPDGTGFGYSDVDVFVVVPLPTAAYAGLGMLAGVMGLSYTLRRR